MELQWLEEFVSIAETHSFQEAAAAMNISQSSLSKHMKNLENELGISLFDRTTRSVKTNIYSEAYYPIAKEIVRLYREGSQKLQTIHMETRNEISVAFTPSMGQYGIIEMLTEFSSKYPYYLFKFTETPYVVKAVRSGQCHLGFLPEDSTIGDKIQKMVYRMDQLVALIDRNSPLAAQPHISVRQICEDSVPMILHYTTSDKPYLATRKFLDVCAPYHLDASRITKISTVPTLMKMVQEYQGISVLNQGSLPQKIPEIAVVPIEPVIPVYFYVVYPQRLDGSVSSLLNFIRQRKYSEEAELQEDA